MNPLWWWVAGGLWGLVLLRLFPRLGTPVLRGSAYLFSLWCVVEPFLAAHGTIID